MRLLPINISGAINTRKKQSYSKENSGVRIPVDGSVLDMDKFRLEAMRQFLTRVLRY